MEKGHQKWTTAVLLWTPSQLHVQSTMVITFSDFVTKKLWWVWKITSPSPEPMSSKKKESEIENAWDFMKPDS